MPHKHKRDKKGDQSVFELPPDTIAAPLPASKNAKPRQDAQKHSAKRKQSQKNDDDTPRAFARLMAWQQGMKPRSGLDDGQPKSKKRKREDAQTTATEQPVSGKETQAADMPKIVPGERMRDYAARVDAALPLRGLVTKGKNVNLPGVKRPQTKTERKLQKMQKEWREVDARWKEKLQEAQEEAEEDEDSYRETLTASKRKKKGKRRGSGSDDEDPWAAVAKARKEQQQANNGLVGIHDVVHAPPQLKPLKDKFKTRNGARVEVADVPAAAGSLRRREELGQVRQSIVESYRQQVKKRSQLADQM